MRLLDFGDKPAYVPHERGEAFPQFYEDGDKYSWHHNGMWDWHFWLRGVFHCQIQHNTFDPIWLMGGEL